MAACLDACNLDYAQLHGDEPPEDLAALAPWAFKAIRPANTEEAKRQALRYLPPRLTATTRWWPIPRGRPFSWMRQRRASSAAADK